MRGINPYAYCDGDPINRVDPNGHLSWQAELDIGLGVVGLVLAVFTAGTSIAAAGAISAAIESASAISLVVGTLGVAADVASIASGALEDANPQASATLGWISWDWADREPSAAWPLQLERAKINLRASQGRR